MSTILAMSAVSLITVLACAGCVKTQPVNQNTPAQSSPIVAPVETPTNVRSESAAEPIPEPTPEPIVFSTPIKSAHYVSNTPKHGATLSSVPSKVELTFNFDVATPSVISIIGPDGENYATGETKIGTDILSLYVAMDPEAPDGLYTVNYTACWPDQTCHDGKFQFALQR
jgi:methionine-rich copper-binding protein CopC